MTFKLRWAQCDVSGVTASRLAALMLRHPYNDDEDNWGFAVDAHDGPRLEGRFIERIQSTDTIKSPAGNDVEVRSLEFRVTRFRMDERWPAIEFISPPRSTSTFTNWLWSSTRHELTPGNGSLDLSRLVGALEGGGDHKLSVFEMSVRGVSLSGEVVAKIAAAGKGDVREHLHRYMKPPAVVDCVGVILTPNAGNATTIRAHRSGLVRLTSIEGGVIAVLRSAVFSSFAQG